MGLLSIIRKLREEEREMRVLILGFQRKQKLNDFLGFINFKIGMKDNFITLNNIVKYIIIGAAGNVIIKTAKPRNIATPFKAVPNQPVAPIDFKPLCASPTNPVPPICVILLFIKK